MKTDERVVRRLGYLCKSYDGIKKLITQSKQRIVSMVPEFEPKHQDEIVLMEKIKDRLATEIERELRYFPLYMRWLKHVPGAGPFVCGNLIILYYFKFTKICKDCGGVLIQDTKKGGDELAGMKCSACGKKPKGDGVFNYRIDERDFATISKWWAFLGRKPVDGKMPKRRSGSKIDWNPKGRLAGYEFAQQLIRQAGSTEYSAFYLKEKAQLTELRGAELKKGHIHNMALNKAVKLFLAHFWMVARTIDEKTVTRPYAETIMGHSGILEPFYWEPEKWKDAA